MSHDGELRGGGDLNNQVASEPFENKKRFKIFKISSPFVTKIFTIVFVQRKRVIYNKWRELCELVDDDPQQYYSYHRPTRDDHYLFLRTKI